MRLGVLALAVAFFVSPHGYVLRIGDPAQSYLLEAASGSVAWTGTAATLNYSGDDDELPSAPAAGSAMADAVSSGQTGIAFDIRSGASLNSRSKGGSLQGVATDAAARALFDETAGNPITLATFDAGNGSMKWLRYSYNAHAPCTLNEIINFCGAYFNEAFTELYARFLWRMGRHTNDSGSSHGTVDSFLTSSDACNAANGTGYGRKLCLFSRSTDPQDRCDWLWKGTSNKSYLSLTSDLTSWEEADTNVHAEDLVGQVLECVWHVKAETSEGNNDGVSEVWIKEEDDTVHHLSGTDGTFTADTFGDNGGVRTFDLGSVFSRVPQNQVEYFTDLVVWGVKA